MKPYTKPSIRGENNPAKRPYVRKLISDRNGMKRKEVSDKHRGGRNGRAQPIIAISPDGREEFFPAVADAMRKILSTGVIVNHGNIRKVAIGERPHTKGWRFSYP